MEIRRATQLRPPDRRRPRVAILAHGHPDYSAGGAEMAAYSLFRALGSEDPEATHLVTWVSPERVGLHAPGEITRLHPLSNEWLYHSPGADWLYQSSHSRAILTGSLIPFLKKIDPDIIHFHHFLGFGLDAIRLIRTELPAARIVFTLHEFLAICLRDGQMVTSGEGRLCSHASPVKCSGCVTTLRRSHFALREEWFKRHFTLVDGFLSPSHFLRDRYVEWGVPADKIEVIDNAQICTTIARPAVRTADQGLFATFGFFGQINPYKGADILVEAARSLLDLIAKGDSPVPTPRILVYGTMSTQTPEFQARMLENLSGVGEVLDYRGGYDRHEVLNLMSACGWVVTPSTWWENSPVVIEEAFAAGRPVICSNIGGMREKVVDGVNGLHFRARDPHDLARVMMGCLKDPGLWDRLRGGVRQLPSMHESARSHHDYYERLTNRSGQAVPVA